MNYDHLFELLTAYRNPRAFNQYRDVDLEFDLPHGAEIRRRNLRCYLETFAGARYVLVGEAAGYAGCRFSGIPFTCEAQLVGPERLRWTLGKDMNRSSVAETLWVERSARIVWPLLSERPDCVLWNAFPWHPFGERGPLSNRAPGRDLSDGLQVLRCLLALFPSARPYAVGRVAERALATIGLQAPYIRHPSRGGKHKFIAGVAALHFEKKGLFGISHGQSIGLPNLLGASREKPEQVRESDVSILQTPRDPKKGGNTV